MRRIGLGLFIIGITFAKAYGQEDYGPVNTGAANYLTIPADARSAAMGGVGVAAPGGDHAVFHNGAAALSDVTRRGGVAYTYSPWMRDYALRSAFQCRSPNNPLAYSGKYYSRFSGLSESM